VQALDQKDLALFVLVAIACALFVAGATFAGVRQRRREIAILGTLGWRPGAIFTLVLSESALLGVLSGTSACLIAVALAEFGSLQIPALRLALIVPLAAVLALAAGALPAWKAAGLPPLEALRPATLPGAAARRVRSVSGLALANVIRAPARSLVAIATLALAVATLSLILGIDLAFHGAVAGTLLGNVISLDVRGVDTASTALVLLVGVGAVVDVLLISLRERSRELATLRASGWSERDVASMALREGLALGLAGSILGAAAGIVLVALLGGSISATLESSSAAAGGGCALTMLALIFPVGRLVNEPPATGFATTEE
jgi:ABC-type antimicrobial peptide transport system permease subunit